MQKIDHRNCGGQSFINSAALKKLRRAAGICHSVLRNRCAFRCRATVAVDSDERRRSVGRLFQMSGPESSCDWWLCLSIAHSVCWRQPTSDADVQQAQPLVGKAQPDTGVLVPADTCWPASRSCILSAGQPEARANPAGLVWCSRNACSSDQPCCGILKSLQLSNDAVSSSNQ